MAIVVKWDDDGEYLKDAEPDDALGSIILWTSRQRRAKRFENQACFRMWATSVGMLPKSERPSWWGSLRYFRLVPRKRYAPPQP